MDILCKNIQLFRCPENSHLSLLQSLYSSRNILIEKDKYLFQTIVHELQRTQHLSIKPINWKLISVVASQSERMQRELEIQEN